jgi:uncharacterized membrane protein YcjF (UPF0283 family)
MYFDWITWSIWLVGFIILVIWILVPVREFRKIVRQKRLDEYKKTQKVNSGRQT